MSSSKEGDKDPSRKFAPKVLKRPDVNNGGSLEDCISNVYNLLELPGIKWKCFRTKSNAPRGVPLTSDLVLKAYSQCLLDGILCAWRRKPSAPTDNDELLPPTHFFSNDSPKELWVFWYEDEPESLVKYCEGLDSDEELSSANQMNIVSYEVRTLLFKALHVLMERDFTRNGFVRFARWFTMPMGAKEHYLHHLYPSHSPAIQFNFFVHGTSTVCASIQAQRQPTLIKLSKRHFECKTPKRFSLVVAPWSMRGYLIADQQTLLNDAKIMEDAEREYNQWKEFLELEENVPETVAEEKQKTPEPEAPAPPQTTRVLLASSSDEEPKLTEEISNKFRWMYEMDIRQDKPRILTPAMKERRLKAREVRRLRRARREEKLRLELNESVHSDECDSDSPSESEKEEEIEEVVTDEVPKMVFIEIDNVRLLWPSKFVCITVDEDRHMLESMGMKTNPVPLELFVQNRRPRNKNVVSAMNPILSTMAVYQYVQNERRIAQERFDPKNADKFKKKAPAIPSRPLVEGEEPPPEPVVPEPGTFLTWGSKKYLRKIRKTTYFPTNLEIQNEEAFMLIKRDPVDTEERDENGEVIKRLKKRKIGGSWKPDPTFRNDIQEFAYERMLYRTGKTTEFHAYHKKRKCYNFRKTRVKPLRPHYHFYKSFKDIQGKIRKVARPRLKELKKKVKPFPTGPTKSDSDDELFAMDKLCQQDWANLEEDDGRPIPNFAIETEEILNPACSNVAEGEEPDIDSDQEPFIPFSTLCYDNPFNEYQFRPEKEEEMTDERFNVVFKDKRGRWKPGMSRTERIEVSAHTFDPTNEPSASPRPYHLLEPLDSPDEEVTPIPKPLDNLYFRGEIVENGLTGYEEVLDERDMADAIKQARWLKHYWKKRCKREVKTARDLHKETLKQVAKRNLKKALQRIRVTAKKDTLGKVKQPPPPPKVDPVIKKKTDAKVLMLTMRELQRDLQNLDMSEFCQNREKAGPHGVTLTTGYMRPNYLTTPHCSIDEESESEIDERTGLGEGTSDQYQEGDPIDLIDLEPIHDNSIDLANIGHIRTVGEHIGPDGMLSPPASNEMPKGGPLSVGPPSIESQGLNQIYPTPPSVQMLQGDAAQAHSPIHGKLRSMMNDDMERIAVPDGVGTIEEIEVEDTETKNMQTWNKRAMKSKLSKFLVASCNNPILQGRKIKYDTPMTNKFDITTTVKKASAKVAWKTMVTRNFEYAPPTTFAELIKVKKPERRVPPPLDLPSTSTAHMQAMMAPMGPSGQMFQTPTFSPHPAQSPFSAGPIGHNPMGPQGYPPTPGQYPPGTPTYPGMAPRPGSNFGYPNPHQMMSPAYSGQMGGPMGGMGGMGAMGGPMGGPMGMQRQFSNPQMYQQQQQMQFRMQQIHRQMSGHGYGAPGVSPYHQQSPVPGGYGMPSGPSSVQRLNNFVNQSQFGPSSGPPQMPYGSMPPMIPQSPNFNQPYQGMTNPMMSPMQQQHQFHQQQMIYQQHQHQMQQMQRNQAQQMQHVQIPPQSVQPVQPTPQMLLMQQNEEVDAAFQKLSEREKSNYQKRQKQLMQGLMPTSLQPVSMRNLKNPPDPNVPFKKHDLNLRPPDINVPRGDSLTIAVVLSDTLLDLHFDSVFDACPICSCSTSIRSRDLGMYITPHSVLSSREQGQTNMREYTTGNWSGFHVTAATNCTCGFSAIRHRYLSCCAGLFDEDADEATASEHSNASVIPPLTKIAIPDMMWFDSHSVHDLALINQIKTMAFTNSLGKAVSQMATVKEQNRNCAKAIDIGTDITIPSEYVLSHVDTLELLMLGMSALGPFQKSTGSQYSHQSKFLSYFHPWGFQTANEITELDETEWVDLLAILSPTLESAMKQARRPPLETPLAIEGPMTWKEIVTTSIRGKPPTEDDEDFSLAEPIPAVMRALETEAVRAAPNIEQFYENAGLGPVDQPKDVMYITVIPDNDDIYARTVKFMDTVTDIYERMRLGRHIPFPVSTGTATRFREIYKAYQPQFPFQEQQHQLVNYTNGQLRTTPPKLASSGLDPLETDSEKWAARLKRKNNDCEELTKMGDDFLEIDPIHVVGIQIAKDKKAKLERLAAEKAAKEAERLQGSSGQDIEMTTPPIPTSASQPSTSQTPQPSTSKASQPSTSKTSQPPSSRKPQPSTSKVSTSKVSRRKGRKKKRSKKYKPYKFVLKRKYKRPSNKNAKKATRPTIPVYPEGFFEREGILRVGTPNEPVKIPHTVTKTAEFENMTRLLSDENGFVRKLRFYLEQMEDLVHATLNENDAAFDRSGYRYQMAVEGRLKRQKHKRDVEEERIRFEASKLEDEAGVPEKPTDEEVIPELVIGNDVPGPWINDELEEKRLQKQKENEQYPPEGVQAPSPVPAGMIHIPETLSEQERSSQPSLENIFADPTAVAPINAQNIVWKQRDTRVPNPFPSSNQPPVTFEAAGSADNDPPSTLPHVIVIYIVNPFSYGPEGNSALHMRIALLSFIRAFNSIVGRLPYQKRPQIQLEIIGQEALDDGALAIPDYFNDPQVPFDLLHEDPSRIELPSEGDHEQIARSLSVAVYTHPRVLTPDVYKSVSARCMTAFGPGSQLLNTITSIEKINQDAFYRMSKRSKTTLDTLDNGYRHPGMMPQQQIEQKNYISYRIPSNIVCLAPPPPVYQMDEDGRPVVNQLDEQTLFISYCLVGTEYLVATATDAQGKLIDNVIANIKPRTFSNEVYRFKHKTQILDGMGKLWTFILGVMASETKNWRLVVGRLGRIGHGEFRAWTHLLNKTSLLRYSSSLKDICSACRSMPSAVGTPAILSACLITLEPEPSIRIMPDFHRVDETSKKSQMFQTPGDLSCTHILTFPVGTEINLEVQDQAADTKGEENWEFGDLDIMEGLDDGDTEIMKDLGLETPGSAAIRQSGGASMFFSEDSSSIEIQNQPLASGYYISTAPAPELPTWFWATCPSAKRHSPVHLKSSLHINISEVKNDDIAMESAKEKEKEKEERDIHPLESRQTEEVLRHVLESYNALSWLNVDRATGERYSCLPIHVQHLLRLYHSVARLLAKPPEN